LEVKKGSFERMNVSREGGKDERGEGKESLK
jgi:hypothetical protein